MAEERKPIVIEQPHVIVVEGDDEVRFFGEFVKYLGLRYAQIVCAHGKDNLPGFIKALPLAPGFSMVDYLSVIRDADTDRDAAFQSVCGALYSAQLQVPDKLMVPTPTEPKPSVAVLILPGDDLQGMLEDLCLNAVAQDPAMKCVDGYFLCLKENGHVLPANMAKARAHAFLSSRQKPDLSVRRCRQGQILALGFESIQSSQKLSPADWILIPVHLPIQLHYLFFHLLDTFPHRHRPQNGFAEINHSPVFPCEQADIAAGGFARTVNRAAHRWPPGSGGRGGPGASGAHRQPGGYPPRDVRKSGMR